MFYRLLWVVLVISCSQENQDSEKGYADKMGQTHSAPEVASKSVATEGVEPRTWKRSAIIPHSFKLMIGDKEEIPLAGSEINVLIEGFRARVLIDSYFYNRSASTYEGTFKVALPSGASPYFLAFGNSVLRASPTDAPQYFHEKEEITRQFTPQGIMEQRKQSWVAPQEARMVTKEKAAYAYTQTVAKKIDPALMEWSGPDIFSARVFPLNSKTMQRIVIGYDINLLAIEKDWEYRLDLPPSQVQRTVTIQVMKLTDIDISFAVGGEETYFSGNSNNDNTNGNSNANSNQNNSVDKSNSEINDQDGYLTLHIDDPAITSIAVTAKKPGAVAIVGKDQAAAFFATQFSLSMDSADHPSSVEKAIFLIDISLSANPDQFNIWIKLLAAILENNDQEIKQFAVLVFNIERFWWQETFVENNVENRAAVLAFANQLVLEGATNLQRAIVAGAAPQWITDNEKDEKWTVFLLSDGAVTWGENERYNLSESLKTNHVEALYAYNAGFSGTDVATLGHLARESGGALYSLLGESELPAASMAHRKLSWEIEQLTAGDCQDLLVAGRPTHLYPEQTVLLVGRCQENPAEVTIKLKRGTDATTVKIPVVQTITSDLVGRIYGQVAVGQLESFDWPSDAITQAYANHFRVTGKTSSLLMLESEADYKRFGINPGDDIKLIRQTLVSKRVKEILGQISEALGDPKVSVLNTIKKLQTMPGMTFNPSIAFLQLLKSIPTSAFTVVPTPFDMALTDRTQLSRDYLTSLAKRNIDYDKISDEASRRLKENGTGEAMLAASTLLEHSPGDSVLARDIGYSALEWGLGGHAYYLLRNVINMRPYEPQTYRAMGRALESIEKWELALIYYEMGLMGQFDPRFGDFTTILAMDYLHLLRSFPTQKMGKPLQGFVKNRLTSLSQKINIETLDILVAITWNTDGTDIDLHIVEPNGESCYYANPYTEIGGRLTKDVTQGYGPEMYLLKKALPGKYTVKVNFFAANNNRASAASKVSVTIFQGFGTKQETVRHKTVRLDSAKDMQTIDSIIISK